MIKDKITDILFLDIETIPKYESYDLLPDEFKLLWEKKSAYFRKADELPADVYGRAGIWAEFGQIICISCGYIVVEDGVQTLRLKSFFGHDEQALLVDFSTMLERFFKKNRPVKLCAHNGKEFDFPYIARRMIINRLPLPACLNMAGRKSWEVPHIDTLELWKFGDYKHYSSLNLLTTILGIPTPKDDIDGSQVAEVYYKEQNMERIVRYCEKDVLAVAQVLLRFRNEPPVERVVSKLQEQQ